MLSRIRGNTNGDVLGWDVGICGTIMAKPVKAKETKDSTATRLLLLEVIATE